MLGIIADLLSSVISILFPIFASYKAIRTSDLTQIAPWLMYWVIISIFLLVESWTYFIIGWFPFYSWIRLFTLAYLVLPQTQGATKIYLEHVEPYLVHHEREIEHFIAKAHERAKTVGLQQLYKLIDMFREKVLGLPPAMTVETAPAPAGGAASYAQALFSRFNLPAAGAANLAAPANELYSLLSSTLASANRPRGVGGAPGATEGLLPREIASAPRAEQEQYILSLRDRLGSLMSMLDRQREDLDPRETVQVTNDDLAYGTSYELDPRGLRKNRSDNSFENIDHDDLGISSSLERDDELHYEQRRRW